VGAGARFLAYGSWAEALVVGGLVVVATSSLLAMTDGRLLAETEYCLARASG